MIQPKDLQNGHTKKKNEKRLDTLLGVMPHPQVGTKPVFLNYDTKSDSPQVEDYIYHWAGGGGRARGYSNVDPYK